jgi:hypothetical protein
MGLSIESCVCLKNDLEKQTEFTPIGTNLKHNLSNKNNLFASQKTASIFSINNVVDKNSTILKNKEISDDVNKNNLAIKLQRVIRAFLFRKKFFKFDGLKDQLISDNDEILKRLDTEFISSPLLETDKIIKKDLNDDFLLKLEANETRRQKTGQFTIKTDGLVTKYLNGEPCLYKGEINVDGKFNGYGELYFKNGKKYEGKFNNGKLNGYGRLIDLFGLICYEGIFKDNQLMDGKGKIIKIEETGEKTIYEGDIKNMKKEGMGIEKNKDYTYVGSFSDDLKHGKGEINYNETDDKYEGEFLNGKITGNGKYQWGNKCTYEGEFLDGKMHGKGVYKWPEGDMYTGNYVNNLREGYGEYTRENGKKYKGEYKAGKPHGKGIISDKNGNTLEVEYENGKIIKKEKQKASQRTFTLKDMQE